MKVNSLRKAFVRKDSTGLLQLLFRFAEIFRK